MSAFAETNLGGVPITWCGPHTCDRCRAEGHPVPQWHHVLVLGRACPMGGAISDCLDHRLAQLPARKGAAA